MCAHIITWMSILVGLWLKSEAANTLVWHLQLPVFSVIVTWARRRPHICSLIITHCVWEHQLNVCNVNVNVIVNINVNVSLRRDPPVKALRSQVRNGKCCVVKQASRLQMSTAWRQTTQITALQVLNFCVVKKCMVKMWRGWIARGNVNTEVKSSQFRPFK